MSDADLENNKSSNYPVTKLNFSCSNTEVNKIEGETEYSSSFTKLKQNSQDSVIEKLDKSASSLLLNEESMAKVLEFMTGFKDQLSKTHLEDHYTVKDKVVSDLMVNLHEIITEAEKIKTQIPKPKPPICKKTSLFNKSSKYSAYGSKGNFDKDKSLEEHNTSTFSRRSLTSNKTKMTSFNKTAKSNNIQRNVNSNIKPPEKEIIPNKYQIMSPKVCISIGVKAKPTKLSETAKVEVNLDDKSLKTNTSLKKIDKLNDSYSKKPNTKKTNLSTPNPGTATNGVSASNKSSVNTSKIYNDKSKGGVVVNNNNNNPEKPPLKTPKKNEKIIYKNDQEEEHYPTLEDSMKMNSTFKFEPKKKNQNVDTEVNCSQLNSVEIEKKENLNESLMSKKKANTRNSSNNINSNQNNTSHLDNNTSIIGKSYKVESSKEIIKLKVVIHNKRLKEFFNNKNNKPIKEIMRFLKVKDRKKIRLLSQTAYNCFVEYELDRLQKNLGLKQEAMSLKNPFSVIQLGKDFILKAQKASLLLSDYFAKDDYSNKGSNYHLLLVSFVDCLYAFYFLRENDNTLADKIKELEANVINKNAYFFFETIIDNVFKNQKTYDFIKSQLQQKKLNFFCCSDISPNSQNNSNNPAILPFEFKYYTELFKCCKNIIDDDLKMVNLVEAEILSSKIDKFKMKFPFLIVN